MSHVTYKIVQHDGGWAILGDCVFSETFSTHEAGTGGGQGAPPPKQRVPGRTEASRIRDRPRISGIRDAGRQ